VHAHLARACITAWVVNVHMIKHVSGLGLRLPAQAACAPERVFDVQHVAVSAAGTA
jgi:hypothetical protein